MNKNWYLLFAAIAAAIIILVPLSAVSINIMYSGIFIWSMYTLVVVLRRKGSSENLPRVVLWLSILVVALDISSTKSILTADSFEAQNALLRFVSFNYIGEIITALLAIAGANIFLRGCKRIAKVKAQIALDFQDCKKKDFFQSLDGSAAWLSGAVKWVSIAYVLSLPIGAARGVGSNAVSFTEGLALYAGVTLSNLVLLIIPSVVLALAVGIVANTGNLDVS